MISDVGLQQIATGVGWWMDHAVVHMKTTDIEASIIQEVEGNDVLKVTIHLAYGVSGDITNIDIIDIYGNIFDTRQYTGTKKFNRDLYITFRYNIRQVVNG